MAATGRQTRELSIAYPLPPNENITADLTGAYLLGYDAIQVTGPAIPAGDRELIRDSTRRLAGMEIVEEDRSHVTLQFLLDPTTLDPRRILLRMNSIALGMFGEVLKGMETGELSALGTLRNRDAEVNRQYFLLVRLIRSALVDGRISHAFDLEGVDVLDYRVAANLLENAGDSIVALGAAMRDSGLPAGRLRGARGAARDLEEAASRAVRALVERDRRLAIQAISLHASYQEGLAALRADAAGDMALIDVVYGSGADRAVLGGRGRSGAAHILRLICGICQEGADGLGVLDAARFYHLQQVRYGMPLDGYYLVLVGVGLGLLQVWRPQSSV